MDANEKLEEDLYIEDVIRQLNTAVELPWAQRRETMLKIIKRVMKESAASNLEQESALPPTEVGWRVVKAQDCRVIGMTSGTQTVPRFAFETYEGFLQSCATVFLQSLEQDQETEPARDLLRMDGIAREAEELRQKIGEYLGSL